MYDELIKNLRHDSASALQNCEFDFVHGWMLKAADAIEELEKQLDEETEYATALACNVPHWTPVTEMLPEKNQEVLIFLFGEDPYLAWHNGKYWCTEDFRLDEPDDWQPTYWFPLPQPPEDGE